MAAPPIKKTGKGSKASAQKATEPAQGPIGNTGGVYVPVPQPNQSGGPTKIPIVPEGEEEKGFLEKKQASLQKGIDDWVETQGDSKLAMAGGALATALNQVFFPTAWYELIPAGKALKLVKKGKEGIEAANKARKAEEAAKDVKKTEKAADKAQDAKKAEANSGGSKKGKGKLKCGDDGTYKDLKKKTAEGKFDRDHIPSKAALKEYAKTELNGGRALTPKQIKAIDNAGNAIAIPRQAHIDISPTHGQSLADAAKDAKNLAGSAKRDVDAMLEKIEEYDEDGNCKKAYKKASKKILKMSNDDYHNMLKDIMKKVK
jgi:hypothetical protein